MEFEGKIWKHRNFWLVEVPALDLMTQGVSKDEALDMVEDAVKGLLISYLKPRSKIEVFVNYYGKGVIGIGASDTKLLLALSLRRQREKSGLTLREAAASIGSKSPNAYAQYEKGKTRISLDQYDKLLHVVNPKQHSLLRFI